MFLINATCIYSFQHHYSSMGDMLSLNHLFWFHLLHLDNRNISLSLSLYIYVAPEIGLYPKSVIWTISGDPQIRHCQITLPLGKQYMWNWIHLCQDLEVGTFYRIWISIYFSHGDIFYAVQCSRNDSKWLEWLKLI